MSSVFGGSRLTEGDHEKAMPLEFEIYYGKRDPTFHDVYPVLKNDTNTEIRSKKISCSDSLKPVTNSTLLCFASSLQDALTFFPNGDFVFLPAINFINITSMGDLKTVRRIEKLSPVAYCINLQNLNRQRN